MEMELGSDDAISGLLRALGVSDDTVEEEEEKFDGVILHSDTLGKDSVSEWMSAVRSALKREGLEGSIEWRELDRVAQSVDRSKFEEGLIRARKLAKRIRPFDIAEFKRRYDKSEEMSDALKDQSCWLFAGPTGAGKSTTIHFLAGSEMVREENGHIRPEKVTNPSLKALPEDAVRPGENLTTSETRFISGVEQDLTDVDDLDVDRRDFKVMFTDSPGFEDTAGAETDLSNGLCMVRALRKAERVKIVIVFSDRAFGSRMSALKRLAGSLAGMLGDFEKTLKSNVGCLITRAADDKKAGDFRDEFKRAFQEEKAKDHTDDAFADLMYNLSRKRSVVEIVRPLEPDLRVPVLESLLEVDYIEEPESAFQEFVNGETLSIVREQFERYKNGTINLCKTSLNAESCRIISKWLTNMQYMTEVLPTQDRLKQFLQECEDIVADAWNSRVEKAKQILDGVLEVSVDLFRKQLREFEQNKRDLQSADIPLLKGKVQDASTVDLWVNDAVKQMLDELERLSELKKRVTNDQWMSIIGKVRELLMIIDEPDVMHGVIEDRIWNWQVQCLELTKKCKKDIQISNWTSLRDIPGRLEYLSQVIVALEDVSSLMGKSTHSSRMSSAMITEDIKIDTCEPGFNNCSQLSEISVALKRHLLGLMNEKCADLNCDFDSEMAFLSDTEIPCSPPRLYSMRMSSSSLSSPARKIRIAKKLSEKKVSEEVRECNDMLWECMDTLKNVSVDSAFPVPMLILDEVQRAITTFHGALTDYAEGLLATAHEFLDSGERWKDAEDYLKICNALRTVNEVSLATSNSYMNSRITFDDKLSALSTEVRRGIEEAMRVIDEDESDGAAALDYGRLANCVESLVKAGCEPTDDRIVIISKRVAELMETLKERVDAMQISIEKSVEFALFNGLISQLYGLYRLGRWIAEVKEQVSELSIHISIQFKRVLTHIESEYDLERFSLEPLKQERTALQSWMRGFKEMKSRNREIYSRVCNTVGDLDGDLLRPLRDLISDQETGLQKLDEKERVGSLKIMEKMKELDGIENAIATLAKLRKPIQEELKNAGVEDLDALMARKDQLKLDLDNFTDLCRKEREQLNSKKRQFEDELSAAIEYAKVESTAISSGLELADLITFRSLPEKADQRLDVLNGILGCGWDYNLPKLNINRVMQATQFIEGCNRINWKRHVIDVKPQIESANENLKQFLDKQGDRWENGFSKVMAVCFGIRKGLMESLTLLDQPGKTYKFTDEKIDVGWEEEEPSDASLIFGDSLVPSPLENSATELSVLLNELRSLYTLDTDRKDVDLSTLMFGTPAQNKVSDVLEILFAKQSELKLNTQKWKSKRTDLCDQAAKHCHALTRSDTFIKWAVSKTSLEIETFAELALALDENVEGTVEDSVKECLNAFDSKNFRKVRTGLDELEKMTESRSRKSYDYVCNLVVNRLKQQFTECLMNVMQLDDSMTDHDMLQLTESLEKLLEAVNACDGHISGSNECEVRAKELQLKNELNERLINLLKGADKAAQTHHFSLAEKRLKNISRMVRFFASGVGGMINADMMKNLKEKQTLVRDEMTAILDGLTEKFRKVDLRDFKKGNPYTSLQPKRLFEEMSQVWAESPFYRTKWDEIKGLISEKMLQALSAVTDEDQYKYYGFKERQRILRLCRSVMRWIPDEMTQTLNDEIKDAEDLVKTNKTLTEGEIDHYIDSEDWDSVIGMMDELQRGDQIFARQTWSKIEKICKDLRAKITAILQREKVGSSDAAELIPLLRKLFRFMDNFNESAIDLEKMKTTLKITVEKITGDLRPHLLKAGDSLALLINATEDSFSATNKLFRFVGPVYQFFQTVSLVPENLERILSQLKDKCHDGMAGLNNDLQNALNELNPQDLQPIVNLSAQMDDSGLYNEIMKIVDRIELPKHKDICQMVDEKLTRILSLVNVSGLSNSNLTESDTKRRELLEYLKNQSDTMLKFRNLYKYHIGKPLKKDFEKRYIGKVKAKLTKDVDSMLQMVKQAIVAGRVEYQKLTYVECVYQVFILMHSEKKYRINTEFLGQCPKKILGKINIIIEEEVESTYQACCKSFDNLNVMATNLVHLWALAEMIDPSALMANARIDDILGTFENDKKLRKNVLALGEAIQSVHPDFGGRLVDSKPIFEIITRSIRTKKMVELSIDDVLRKLAGYKVKLDVDGLREKYLKVDEVYQETIVAGLRVTRYENINYTTLINRLQSLAREAQSAQKRQLFGFSFSSTVSSWFGFEQSAGGSKEAEKVRKALWNGQVKKVVPEMLGLCFALWTLKNSQCYFDDSGDSLADKSKAGFLLQPRVAQIISVLCLLGLDETRTTIGLVNNLVEIGTGEGKSLTLAISSMVLALLGFEVNCACFSELLSQRDYDSFVNLFEAAGVVKSIHYGTFNALFERMINRGCNVRSEVLKLLDHSKKKAVGPPKKPKPEVPAILLIDEVDVFFQKSFFGSLYQQSVIHKSASFKNFIRWIWKSQKSGVVLDLESLQRSSEFTDVLRQYAPEWKDLLLEAAKDVVDAAKSFASDTYVVKDGRIGYKFQDTISFKASKGYKTMFAYLSEFDNGTVTAEKVDDMLGFFVKIASFSYAEIPASFYAIVGVTGTLRTLTQPEKDIMESGYNIRKHVYMPSLFGDSQLQFAKNEDTVCVETAYYQSTLNTAIMTARTKSAEVKRPVVVIFEDRRALNDFYNSDSFSPIRDDPDINRGIQILTEEHSSAEKKRRIKLASQKGQITLTTGSFGRGVDYQVYDEQVNSAGGMHVEAAFLSPSNAEEVQFRGRTARQGSKGSFHMTIDIDNCLEKFGVTKRHIQEWKNNRRLYDGLSEFRDRQFVQEYNESLEFVYSLKKMHEESEEMACALRLNDFHTARSMLLDKNRGAFLGRLARMSIAIDATGSMGSLLNQVKKVISQVIPQLSEFLSQNGFDPRMFQIQITYYRNYNAPIESLKQASPWSSDVTELATFMQDVQPEYGWGDEAVEVAFYHIAGLAHAPDFVLLIGDAPAHSMGDVIAKRKRRGNSYWNQHGIPEMNWSDELDKLIKKDIRVNCFHLNDRAQKNFNEIAKRSGGVCRALDVQREAESIAVLKSAIADQVLHALGDGSRELLDAFHRQNPDLPSFL